MAGEIFRHAVNDNVRSELERLLKVRRRKCVVHDDEGATRVGELTDSRNIVNKQAGIGWSFNPDQPGSRRNRAIKGGSVARIDLLDAHAERLENFVEDSIRSTVYVEWNHDFIAWLEIRL